MKPLSYKSPDVRSGKGMEIPGPGARSRWLSFTAYAIVFIAVAALFVLLFIQFTSSWRLAVILVGFLVGYMILMGWWASRNVEGRE